MSIITSTITLKNKAYILIIGEDFDKYNIYGIYHNIDMAIDETKNMLNNIFRNNKYTFRKIGSMYEWKSTTKYLRIDEFDVPPYDLMDNLYVVISGEKYEGYFIHGIYTDINKALSNAKKILNNIYKNLNFTLTQNETTYEWIDKSTFMRIEKLNIVQ